ncbi:MAG: hypothetical protein IJP68_02715 [Selenomonadaceae bacterium]|nr:hypothetical protein [Selenomonadaceae bacterium]
MKKFLIVALSFICLICAGCFEVKFGLTITDSGAVIQHSKFIGTAALAPQIEAWKNQAEENNPNLQVKAVVEGDLRGYKFDVSYPDIETFAKMAGGFYVAHPEKNSGISRYASWFFDTYDFDLYFAGAPELTAFETTVNQALLSQAVFDVEINLPYAADSTNADEVSADGKYLKWHLAHVTINGGEKFMQARFKLWHKDKLAATAAVELLLLFATIFFAIKAHTEDFEAAKDFRFKRNVFAGLFVALTALAAFMIH